MAETEILLYEFEDEKAYYNFLTGELRVERVFVAENERENSKSETETEKQTV